MNILITGGAGYIGSHVAKQLLETTSYNIIIIDNLSTGSMKTLNFLKTIRDFTYINLDLNEFNKVAQLINNYNIDTVMHFAASIVVPESVSNPLKYYTNNTMNTINLIQSCIELNVKKFIFSSTAAVYGEPNILPQNGIDETFPAKPINPYGMSKLMCENVLQDTATAHPEFKFVIFRYFNVAGADIFYNDKEKLTPRIGQSFPNATHLIKIASECALGTRKEMSIFGDQFNTIDGTGVRDYIHVDDLAEAHIKAINFLDENSSDIFNVGYGKGYSVKEVINTMKSVTNTDFKVNITTQRKGDPAMLTSDNSKIKTKMHWTPRYDNLALICNSAYSWEIIKSKN